MQVKNWIYFSLFLLALFICYLMSIRPTALKKDRQTKTRRHKPFFSGAKVLNLICHLRYLILEPLNVKEGDKEETKVNDEQSQTWNSQ